MSRPYKRELLAICSDLGIDGRPRHSKECLIDEIESYMERLSMSLNPYWYDLSVEDLLEKLDRLGIHNCRRNKISLLDRLEKYMESVSLSPHSDWYNWEREIYNSSWDMWWWRFCCSNSGSTTIRKRGCECERVWHWCSCDREEDVVCCSTCGERYGESLYSLLGYIDEIEGDVDYFDLFRVR